MKILKRFLIFFVAAAVCGTINAFAALNNKSFENAVEYKIGDTFNFYTSEMNGGSVSPGIFYKIYIPYKGEYNIEYQF